MALTSDDTKAILSEYQRKAGDTGSAEVQIALLSEKIQRLSLHLQKNKGDNNSKRGLMKLVGSRKKMLRYLFSKNENTYREIVKKLGIRSSL